MKKEKEYEIIAEFFYEKAARRVRDAVEESGLNYSDILKSDTKQISRIINNSRQRNNPYLINDSALKTSYKDEVSSKNIPCGLLPNLSFNSRKEVLWGTDEEIELYIHDLFMLLWNEVCVENRLLDTELYLCDYIPYAKYGTYWKILFESDTINDPRFSFLKFEGKPLNFPALFFLIKEDDVIENIDSAREEALEYLYDRCKGSFTSSFIAFANQIDTFHMLNKTIKNKLIMGTFLPVLNKFKPDASSLGLRVKNLIYEDLSYSAVLMCRYKIDNPEYRHQLLVASSEYIRNLEFIQSNQYKKKKWS